MVLVYLGYGNERIALGRLRQLSKNGAIFCYDLMCLGAIYHCFAADNIVLHVPAVSIYIL